MQNTEGTVTISIETYERLVSAEKAIKDLGKNGVIFLSYIPNDCIVGKYVVFDKDDLIAELNNTIRQLEKERSTLLWDNTIMKNNLKGSKIESVKSKTIKKWWQL